MNVACDHLFLFVGVTSKESPFVKRPSRRLHVHIFGEAFIVVGPTGLVAGGLTTQYGVDGKAQHHRVGDTCPRNGAKRCRRLFPSRGGGTRTFAESKKQMHHSLRQYNSHDEEGSRGRIDGEQTMDRKKGIASGRQVTKTKKEAAAPHALGKRRLGRGRFDKKW